MAIIVINPPDEAQVRNVVHALQEAGIKARKLQRPFVRGFVNVGCEDTEAALSVLKNSNVEATLRPG
jgi:hypothetical protein